MPANTTAVRDEVYPVVHEALSKSGGEKRYKDCVQRYMDNHPAMFNGIPNNRLAYGVAETEDFYKSLGITSSQITAGLQHTFYWKMNYSPISAKDPLTVSSLMCIRHFLMKNDQKNAELAAIYFAFTGKMYPSAHFGSFRFLPDDCDATMNYVVNTQLNGKFDLKTEKTIFGIIRKMCITWISAYSSRIKRCTDDDVGYVIKQLYSRIKSLLKNFAKLYYDAYENKDYLNYESDNYGEDDYRITVTDTMRADKYTEAAMTYMTNNAVDYKICTMCADQNVKKDEIKEIIESILNNSNNLSLMRELIQTIIADYMRNSDTKDVRDLSFISYSVTVKPNAKDPSIIRIKELIYMFLEDNSAGYRRRKNRIATQNSYYKAILEYVVLIINKANK